MTGKGVLTNVLGSKYEGDFWNGLRHGVGVETFGNNIGQKFTCPIGVYHLGTDFCTYTGSYSMNLLHGEGELKCCSGRWYKGEFKAGKRHGQGHQYYFKEGEMGDHQRLFIGGVGSLYRVREYIGTWEDGIREGNGKIIYTNGVELEGNFKNGQPDGTMVYTFYSNNDISMPSTSHTQIPSSSAGRKKTRTRVAVYENGYLKEWKKENFSSFMSSVMKESGKKDFKTIEAPSIDSSFSNFNSDLGVESLY